MFEPFLDFALDILFFRWLWGGEDKSTARTVVEIIVLLVIVLFVVGAFLGWWW